jgi:lipopolysaccharide export LptBFGC system permease protein LptF
VKMSVKVVRVGRTRKGVTRAVLVGLFVFVLSALLQNLGGEYSLWDRIVAILLTCLMGSVVMRLLLPKEQRPQQ